MNRQGEVNLYCDWLHNIYKCFVGFLLIAVTAAEVGSVGFHALRPGEGIESVEGFCRGLNALDELADIASQLLNQKYPRLGPIRLSCL